MSMSNASNVSTHVSDLVIYTDRTYALISLGLLLFLSMILIYILYVLLTDNEAKKVYSKLGRSFLTLALIFGLLTCALFSLKNISFFIQKEPELIINNRGIQFHTLGFLPWSDVDRIKPMHEGRRRSHIVRIFLKPDSKWQPEATSFFSPSTFSDNSIFVKRALNVDYKELFNTFNRLKPPTKIHE